MKRGFSAFQEEIPPYSGPNAARESHADLQQLSTIPGHICMRPDLQILPGQRRFSKLPWLSPMLEMLPPTSISNLKEWGLKTVLVLAKKYDKIVHVWNSVTALAELWHQQTHTFLFRIFEATILLEELEVMLGLPRYQRGDELTISYTVGPINSWSILSKITTKKEDLRSMMSGTHVHLLPIAQRITSQCKRKTRNYLAIAKAAAICICGVILFPTTDGAISFANLSIVDSLSEGMNIGQAVLGFLYAGLSSAAMGGPFLGSIVALELWMGVHIQFRVMDALAPECKSLLHHPLAYAGGPLHMTTRVWCKTAQVKGLKAWHEYLRRLTAGDMRIRVSWTLVLAAFLAFPPFQRNRIEEMGFGEIFRMERMRTDPALTQALRSRWDTEAMAFVFPWGHMIPILEYVSWITGLRVYGRPVSGFTYPCYHDIAERLLELPVERRSSLIPRKALQEGLGLHNVARQTSDDADEYLEQLVRGSRRELASEPGPQADLDLCRFLILFLGRLLFATRGDVVHCRFLPLLEDLSEVGGYAWGAAFLAHQFDNLGASERQTSTIGFYPFLQVWAYLHLLGLGRGVLERPGLVPIARRWGSPRDYRSLGDQLTRLLEMIDSYPYPDVVWQPYLEESDEGQPQLVQARPYFGSFRGLHDTTDWHVRAQEQINNWERRGKAVKSAATTDDAYLQAYALKYGGKVYKSAQHQVDVAGEIASLWALLRSATQDREVAQKQVEELRRELDRVRSAAAGGASSSRGEESHQRELTDQLAAAVLRAEEAERDLVDRIK
ncbi:hypothetical protein Taro_039415 [Colocasia esculenta]|uniref:Aminotransferase-like plant mobile domain-containing protein n=1 Tax=Colocasia esculenta TaxID=4460 RepID=A0A843WAM0_COLES|nr:hypothetical protein [Colocasia esculenta]